MAQEEEEEVESYNAHNEYFRIEKEARLARNRAWRSLSILRYALLVLT